MPSARKTKAPQTPAKGSSPVSPPAGSAPKPRTQARPGPVRPNATLSPLATARMQQILQQRAKQQPKPAIAPPTSRAPGVASLAPQAQGRPAPQMQTRPGPVPITPSPQPSMTNQIAQGGWGNGLMAGPNTTSNWAAPVVQRVDRAIDNITAPTFTQQPPPSTTGVDQNSVWFKPNTPTNAGVRLNDDGSEDWVTTGPNGQAVYTPKTRQEQPGLFKMATRAVGEAVGIGLEAIQFGAKGIERVIGASVQGTGGAEVTGRVRLPDGTFYTPPTGVDPARTAQNNAWDGTRRFPANAVSTTPQTVNGRPITNPAQAAGITQGAVDVLKGIYPDSPARAQAFSDLTRIAYSPGTSQVRAGIRMLEYSQPATEALYGDGAYINDHLVALGYLDDKLKAVKADPLANYVYESWKADGFTDEQFIQTLETQGLPGEQYVPSELVGQMLLDPLNVVGDLTGPMLEADRAARATAVFTTRTARTGEEIAASLARGITPTGVELLDKAANFFFGRTPTAVKNQILQAGGDALSFGLKAADEVGAKGSRYNVLKALYDFAELAPARLAGQTDEAFALATAAWRSNRQLAESILEKNAPMLLSDAGKLGGSLVRRLLQGQDGSLSVKVLTDIATSDKKPYEIMGELMGKLDDAATNLLLPERAGARTVAEFVANTGKPAQQFPIFERGIAGAGEAVRLEASAATAKLNPANAAIAGQLDYKANGLAHFLAGADSFRNRLNGLMWKVFAESSPAYSARNALNNMVTAIADGNLSFERMDEVDNFLRVLGDPSAAFKGVGSGEVLGRSTKPFAGGFAGFLRSGDLPLVGKPLKRLGVDIPLGAQAVEEMFGKRIVYAAAKRYLDRMMVLGKAIPDLPPSLVTALGDDVTRQLVQHLAGTYGDVEGAFKLAESLRGGASELWRIPADEHMAAVREFGGDLGRQLDALLTGDEMKTAEGIRAGFARLRRETAAQLQVAERNIPTMTAMTGEVGAAYADDTARAVEAGVDPARVTGVKPEDFEARLAAEQNAQQVAQGRAFEALKRQPDATGFQAFGEVQTRVTEGGRKTSEAVKELRTAAWDRTTAIRSMTGLTPEARGNMIGEVWRDYFTKRDALWTSYRRRAIELWDGITVAAGGELVDAMPVRAAVNTAYEAPVKQYTDDAAGLAQYNADVEREVRAEALGNAGAGNFEQVRTMKPATGLTGRDTTVAFDWQDPRWGIQGNNKNKWNIDVSTGTVEAPNIWVNESGAYQLERPKGKGKFGSPEVTAANGERWTLRPAHDVDGWVERFGEAAGYDIGSPDFNWQVIERDLVDHIRNGGGDQARAAMIEAYAQRVIAGEKLPTYFRPSKRQPEGYVQRQLDRDAIMRRVAELRGEPVGMPSAQTLTPSFEAATMPPGVSNVTAAPGGPQVAMNTAPGTIPNFDIPGPQAIPTGGTGDPLQLAMQGAGPRQGPPITMGGGGIGDVNALRGTPMQIPARWTPADPRSILSTLNSMEANALGNLGQTRPVNLDDAQWQLLQDWFQAVRGQTRQARVIAGQVGSEARNFALLNYGDKRNFDAALGVIFPYHYWYGRTYANWMQRAVLNPAMMANYGRYRGNLETMHAALPEYYRQQLSTDDLGLDLETPLMFNLEQTLSPLYGVLGSDFTDPVRRRAQLFGMQGAGAWVEDAGALGPSPWAPIAWATALSSYMGGDKEAGNAWMNNYLGTLPRAIRATTALAGVGGPGGVNVDPQMFMANLMSGNGPSTKTMTQWERGRVATIIAGYGDNPPQGIDPADWQAQVEEAAYTQSGPLWDQAMQEMFVGTAPAVLTSFFAGLGFKGRSETEAEVGQVYAEVARLRANYANMTPEEIQQAYIDLQKRNPIYELLMLSRAQGPQRDDAWVWEAMGRVGLGDREAWQAAGVSEEALDAFFATKTTEGMNPDLLGELLAGANNINARNRPVSIDEQQRQLDAKIAYDAINKQLAAQFPPEAYTLEDEFFRIRDEQGTDTANTWMENLEPTRQALLRGLLDARTEAKMNAGPDVQRYFIDPDRYEAMLVGQYYDQAEVTRPGIGQMSSDYWDLRDSGDYGAAALLLKEHPELKEYWDETAAFKNGVHGEVMAWLATLPASTQGEARADFDPLGLNQDKLDEHYKAQADAQMGIYDSPYGQDSQQPTGATSSTADTYRARYEAEQAAKLAATEGRATYLSSANRLAYSDALIAPMVKEFGPDGAAAYLEQPIAADWPVTQQGVAGLLKMMGDAESVREGLFAYATKTKNADWVRYVALLRNMSDEELSALARKYPQLADAALVAQQARDYEQPTYQALHDILGFSVTFSEDGSYSLNKQSVKKDKEAGTYGPTMQGGGNSSGGGSFGGSSTSRQTYNRMGGGYGGSSGGGSSGGASEAAPDPVAEQAATWINFALTLKQDQPEILMHLMDFFDMPDDYARQAFLQRYPELAQYFTTLGAEKLASLADAYYTWRQDQQDAQQPVVNGKKKQSPQIQRYYRTRPSTTGLQ